MQQSKSPTTGGFLQRNAATHYNCIGIKIVRRVEKGQEVCQNTQLRNTALSEQMTVWQQIAIHNLNWLKTQLKSWMMQVDDIIIAHIYPFGYVPLGWSRTNSFL